MLQHFTLAFAKIRSVMNTGGMLLLEGATVNDLEKSHIEFYYGDHGDEPTRKDRSNWSSPTRRALKDTLRSCYFEVIDESCSPAEHRYTRSTAIAKAVVCENNGHPYPPAFGLSDFDPRFC